MDALTLEKAAQDLPADLVAIISAIGMDKVATHMTGVDASSERTVYEKIGADLFMRRYENAIIGHGLMALKSLGEP